MKSTFQISIVKNVKRKLKGPNRTNFKMVNAGIKDDKIRRILCPKSTTSVVALNFKMSD